MHLFRLIIISLTVLKPLNQINRVRKNSIFPLPTLVSWITCNWFLKNTYAFVSPKNHFIESPQATKSFESNSNEFYFSHFKHKFRAWHAHDIWMTTKCAYVLPKYYFIESPQSTKSFENNSNEFYFCTWNTCFVITCKWS